MARRKSVLFVCIGNACRSQMAEAFARRYGSDVLAPASAGLYPASKVPEATHRVMRERNIEMEGHSPKAMDAWMCSEFELIVNLSGRALPRKITTPMETWAVDDPMGEDDDTHRRVRDEIESLVMRLILAARAEAKQPPEPDPELIPRRAGSAAVGARGPAAEVAPEASEPPRRRKFLR